MLSTRNIDIECQPLASGLTGVYCGNGYRIRGYILKENLSSIKVANMELIYWSCRSSSRMKGEGVNWGGLGLSLFLPIASMALYLKDHENLVQHLRISISIIGVLNV